MKCWNPVSGKNKKNISTCHLLKILARVTSKVCVSEEDTYGSYGRLLLKYFCAEAVMTGHSLLLSSLDYDPQQLLKVILLPEENLTEMGSTQ